MLLKLIIKDFALIDDIEIDFKRGLNILTGETGAGKSIIIDAIGMILGERASSEYIRSGKESSVIEAVFEYDNEQVSAFLRELGIEEEDNTLIISRQITDQGKNYCRINGKSVPVSALKNLGKYLIDIHGQHQHQSLLNPERHLEMLDLLGGDEIANVKKQVGQYYRRILDTVYRLETLKRSREEFFRYREQLQFEIEELERAQLKPQEDVMLEEEREILAHSEKILKNLNFSLLLLYEGDETTAPVIDNLCRIISALEDIKDYFKPVEQPLASLKNILYEVEDVVSTIRECVKSIDFDPGRLDEIQARLALLDRLKSKYNMSIEELLNYKEQAASKLEEALNIDDEISKLESSLKELKENYINSSLKLHELRKKVAAAFEKDIFKELNDLGMKGTKLSVDIKWVETDTGVEINGKTYKMNENGLDSVEFLISTNPGEPLKPLAKIVSGGEASRIMLALKNILARIDNIPCLIFDEIDAGIGGRISQIVGEKMAKVARNHQVLCVTHSPQIASLGDAHFCIRKVVNKNKTSTIVSEIRGEERVKEIARMLGGAEITSTTLVHAREMLKMAEDIKKNL
ncbi:DNA repair protein RecN [Thermosediminibacter oceani]|uniref:DNA repair protein RecN n=1 Tax=Thermosediminibacter oceani (strain ATCC BAA-1034 / DSM 16646 / JW/IW-1228P) TaxID=555079 RepID=D9S3T0_THEOJ|nr:DNA repair protein RecN [Thermosediminibacter oceani]ADL08057.1 DNA repair protein RecN [Thermosediminibacter oceani DSM 16646]